jgi:hypothetical protein
MSFGGTSELSCNILCLCTSGNRVAALFWHDLMPKPDYLVCEGVHAKARIYSHGHFSVKFHSLHDLVN